MNIKKIISSLFVASLLFFGFFVQTIQASATSTIDELTVSPQGCQLVGTDIVVSGIASTHAQPGLLEQYHIKIIWGDTNETLTTASFGTGHGDSGTIDFSASHKYTTNGTYTINTLLYHQNENGNDNQDDELVPITVCIVSPLTITKTANTSLTRTWTWSIDKTADQTILTLANGQIFPVDYSVSANATSTDSNFNVSGNISIFNPAGNPTITVGVADNLATDGLVTVLCPRSTIDPNTTLVCTYSKNLNSATNQLNTVTVAVNESVLSGSANANVNFSTATVTKVDDCATITDTSPSGPHSEHVCSTDLQKVWNYSLTFGKNIIAQVPLICGINSYTNTVSFVADNTPSSGSKSVTVSSNVACQTGCTLTQGYWKTHNTSFKGGAPVDSTWSLLDPLKELKPFYTSGQTWFADFWTAPSGGNIYLQLAHQYMAAFLNSLNGARVTPAVTSALNGSDHFFSYVLNANSTLTTAQKNSAKSYATTLGSYNEGLIGPGHCSE